MKTTLNLVDEVKNKRQFSSRTRFLNLTRYSTPLQWPLPGPLTERENTAAPDARQARHRVGRQGQASLRVERDRLQEHHFQILGQHSASHTTTAPSYPDYTLRSPRPLPRTFRLLSNNLRGGGGDVGISHKAVLLQETAKPALFRATTNILSERPLPSQSARKLAAPVPIRPLVADRQSIRDGHSERRNTSTLTDIRHEGVRKIFRKTRSPSEPPTTSTNLADSAALLSCRQPELRAPRHDSPDYSRASWRAPPRSSSPREDIFQDTTFAA
jgi:hypothetical protein